MASEERKPPSHEGAIEYHYELVCRIYREMRRHGSLDVAAYCHIMLLAVFPDR